jgi:20S proteasome alpha/beta subunit
MILFVNCYTIIHSQTVTQSIQLPNVATLNKFIDFPVDKSTGVPNIAIPIYTLKEKNFSWPISLAYHAGGIRVEEIASNVGLGWSLIADAVVSRTIKGIPDEYSGGFYGHSGPYTYQTPVSVSNGSPPPALYLINQMSSSTMDTEPDMFYFQLGGYLGKFVIDTGRHVRLMPEQDIKIEVSAGNYFAFVITTPDGVQYYFDNNMDYNLPSGSFDGSGITTAWHVSKIVTATQNQIDFEYQEDGGNAQRFLYHESMLIGKGWCPVLAMAEYYQSNVGVTIKSIKSSDCEVRFNYKGAIREDYRPSDQNWIYTRSKALDNIVIKNRLTSDTIQQYKLYTSYFTSNDDFSSQLPTYLKKRLRLDSIKQYNKNGDFLPGYKFAYNKYNPTSSNKLPSRLFTGQDHWGYCNGKETNANLYPTFTFYDNPGTSSSTCPGADRNGNINYIKAYILDEITFPTGGTTKYIYDACRDALDTTKTLGGLRIKEIHSSAGDNSPELKKSYTYFDFGTVGGSPVYQQDVILDNTDYNYYYPTLPLWQTTVRPYMIFTTPVNYSGELTANYIYYGKVIEKSEGNGSIESYYDIDDLNAEQDLTDINTYPFKIHQPLLVSGKLVKEVYKNENDDVLKETEYSYGSSYSNSFINGYLLDQPFGYQRPNYYSLYTGCAYLAEQKETIYTSSTTFLTKKTVYEYGGIPSQYDRDVNHLPVIHRFPTKQTDYLNDTLITRFKYPKDYSAYGFINNLISKNLINVPIEKTVVKKLGNEYLLNGEIQTFRSSSAVSDKTYRYTNSVPMNYGSYTSSVMNSNNILSMDSHYEDHILFNAYDNTSNLVEFQKKNDFKNVLIWDYKSTYPIARVTNADSTSVAYTSFEADGTGNWSGINPSHIIMNLPSVTGRKYFDETGFNISKSGLSSSAYYIVSYWSKNNSAFSITGTQTNWPKKLKTISIAGQDWNYFEHLVTGQTTITVTGSGSLDELRLYPKDAQMITYTYDALIGITSQCDAKNSVIFYTYDSFGRLILARDENNKILKKFCYNYAGQIENCTAFVNVQKSGNFTRNNCAVGGTGSTVTYTVPANTYASFISQADADQQAQNDVNANGQTYANNNGTCTFYNVVKSGNFTRNNCAAGGTGSTVTYTVPAGTYSSTSSQTAADQLAQNDVNANGQTYANNNGTCTFYNVVKSGNFTRNNCATGGTGSTVTYTVPAGTYSSTSSQAAADQLAQNDVNANGQAYANTNGTCTWWNIQKSGNFTRNNCGSGYQGSTVAYIVAANTYSSTTSQSAADQLAQNDVNANGQSYANTNGTCTQIIYARIEAEYVESYYDGCSYEDDYEIYIRFYADANATIPISVSDLDVNYVYYNTFYGNNYLTEPCSGTQVDLGMYYLSGGNSCNSSSYSAAFWVTSGTGYIAF